METINDQDNLSENKRRFARWTRWFLAFIIVIVIVGYGWPLLGIYWNLSKGERVKDSLLTSLRSRYPALVCDGGVGYTGPRVVITIRGEIPPIQQLEIKTFLAEEKENAGIDVEVWVEFYSVSNDDWIRHKL